MGPEASLIEYEQDEVASAVTAATAPNDFNGTSRRKAKTSYLAGTPTVYQSVRELRTSLTPEKTMLSLDIPYGMGSENSDRVTQEMHVVRVTAYLYAYTKEKDHDYHLMVGDAPSDSARMFMNMEVSGLPVTGPYRAKLSDVRSRFKDFFGLGDQGPQNYVPVNPPMPVRITGSVFFDMDHALPQNYVKYNGFEPKSGWEIHPITDIELDINP